MEMTIDEERVDWKIAPLFPPDFVRATLSFVFSVTDQEVHVAVVEDEPGSSRAQIAELAYSSVGLARWLTHRPEVSVHPISADVFWMFWREYSGRLDHPLRQKHEFLPS